MLWAQLLIKNFHRLPEKLKRLFVIALRIENQCYVVGVNRVGCDPACQYSGGSMLVDAYGKTVAECESGKQCALTVSLDLEKLASFRKKFPVLDDAD